MKIIAALICFSFIISGCAVPNYGQPGTVVVNNYYYQTPVRLGAVSSSYRNGYNYPSPSYRAQSDSVVPLLGIAAQVGIALIGADVAKMQIRESNRTQRTLIDILPELNRQNNDRYHRNHRW